MIAGTTTSSNLARALPFLAHAAADLAVAADSLAKEARRRRRRPLVADALRARRLAETAEQLLFIVAADLAEEVAS